MKRRLKLHRPAQVQTDKRPRACIVCGAVFMASDISTKKVCGLECWQEHEYEKNGLGRKETDPSPEEIRKMCKLIRDGKLVIPVENGNDQ